MSFKLMMDLSRLPSGAYYFFSPRAKAQSQNNRNEPNPALAIAYFCNCPCIIKNKLSLNLNTALEYRIPPGALNAPRAENRMILHLALKGGQSAINIRQNRLNGHYDAYAKCDAHTSTILFVVKVLESSEYSLTSTQETQLCGTIGMRLESGVFMLLRHVGETNNLSETLSAFAQVYEVQLRGVLRQVGEINNLFEIFAPEKFVNLENQRVHSTGEKGKSPVSGLKLQQMLEGSKKQFEDVMWAERSVAEGEALEDNKTKTFDGKGDPKAPEVSFGVCKIAKLAMVLESRYREPTGMFKDLRYRNFKRAIFLEIAITQSEAVKTCIKVMELRKRSVKNAKCIELQSNSNCEEAQEFVCPLGLHGCETKYANSPELQNRNSNCEVKPEFAN